MNTKEIAEATMQLPYRLDIPLGEEATCTVYFDLDQKFTRWIVAADFKVFYKSCDITHMLNSTEVLQEIYKQADKVEEQVEDMHWIHMAQYYRPYDEDFSDVPF